jgi:hypothetical protein
MSHGLSLSLKVGVLRGLLSHEVGRGSQFLLHGRKDLLKLYDLFPKELHFSIVVLIVTAVVAIFIHSVVIDGVSGSRCSILLDGVDCGGHDVFSLLHSD